jgi:precorrin-8X/cobalt-precorrin-8 methylmutase
LRIVEYNTVVKGMEMKRLSPREIEDESMKIIEREAGSHQFAGDEWEVVRRVIHATADFEFMKTIRFHSKAIDSGLKAIKRGLPIYTDTEMLAAAIHKAAQDRWGCRIPCFISDEDVRKESETTGETRSTIAMRKAAPLLKGGIIAIGNAPTALQEAISLCEQNAMTPDLIIGMPVGFVGALESKERLYRSACCYITNLDRKGGTPATAAVINALIKLAETKSRASFKQVCESHRRDAENAERT